ncbi:5'-nucleotidase [Hamadaea flava]|uniref:5'-nucleotidase n=1 Tax=Hamadaea flava TaxID=1742688 RepID=A0ABV8LEB3_9ACTN|nr:5'-nucleotidase [Hamadaea flava]MCP2323368.1 5'-nucleotidase [Hamadaea flava]
MPYDLEKRLVIGIASSALFDLTQSDHVFRTHGEAAYRDYQQAKLAEPLNPGVAFPFVKRLLALNDLSPTPDDPVVEVVIMSKNDPDTGLRVMRSVEDHGLAISRAIFMRGRSPLKFIRALSMSLFLSANEEDVQEAIARGFPAGQVLPSTYTDDGDDDLRIAFDFDGVLADDGSEQIFSTRGLAEFRRHEQENATTPLERGPLSDLLREINKIQALEEKRKGEDAHYQIRLHVSIVTARNAPAHERPMASLKQWGVTVNDAFFLGGIEKHRILDVLKPHIFFDDQRLHLQSVTPCVHVPFGVANQLSVGEGQG